MSDSSSANLSSNVAWKCHSALVRFAPPWHLILDTVWIFPAKAWRTSRAVVDINFNLIRWTEKKHKALHQSNSKSVHSRQGSTTISHPTSALPICSICAVDSSTRFLETVHNLQHFLTQRSPDNAECKNEECLEHGPLTEYESRSSIIYIRVWEIRYHRGFAK